MTRIKLLLLSYLSFLAVCCPAAHAGETKPLVNVSAYVDAYFANDDDQLQTSAGNPFNYTRQLTYINYKKNQFGLNTAQVTADLSFNNVRGTVTLQAGDLAGTAWELPGGSLYPMIQQAFAGYNVFDKVWIDAGYFLTHIGGEALLPKDNWLSSHSLVTYYEPFYQAGVRASYESDNLTLQVHILNANGRIEDNNDNKTFGLFASCKPLDELTVSYANVIGNEDPGRPEDGSVHMLHNLVAQYNLSTALSIRAQLDIASKDVPNADTTREPVAGSYLGLSAAVHYVLTSELGATARFAMVNNEDGVYAPVLSGNAVTLGCEYKPADIFYIRLEGTMFQLDDDYRMFIDRDGKASSKKMEIVLNFGVIIK